MWKSRRCGAHPMKAPSRGSATMTRSPDTKKAAPVSQSGPMILAEDHQTLTIVANRPTAVGALAIALARITRETGRTTGSYGRVITTAASSP